MTKLAKHCHPSCLTSCVPSCGSGCCSAEDEQKRGHHFLHYQKIADYHKAKDAAKSKNKGPPVKQHDEPKKITKKQQDKVPCHPQCKETCISSCGKGCCTEEGERLRDEQERKEKDAREKERKEKAKALQEMYKPQPRLCPAPCPQVKDYKFDTVTEFKVDSRPPEFKYGALTTWSRCLLLLVDSQKGQSAGTVDMEIKLINSSSFFQRLDKT